MAAERRHLDAAVEAVKKDSQVSMPICGETRVLLDTELTESTEHRERGEINPI
jgi:hypothetical protein